MTVSVVYGAAAVPLPDGGKGVRLVRTVKRTVKTTDLCGFQKMVSQFVITLTPKDAFEMVRAYRERRFRVLDDIDDESRKQICLNIISGESYSLEWWGKGKVVEDDLWSDWPEAFMAEVESAARDAKDGFLTDEGDDEA